MVRLRLTLERVLPWAPDPFLIGIPNRILQGKGIFCFNSNNGLPRNERNLRISERTNLRIITLSNPYSLLFVWMKNQFRGEGEKPIPLQRKERNETKWNGKTRWGCQLKVVELPSLSYLCVINWKPFLFFEFPYLLYWNFIEELVQAYFFLSFGFSKSIKIGGFGFLLLAFCLGLERVIHYYFGFYTTACYATSLVHEILYYGTPILA